MTVETEDEATPFIYCMLTKNKACRDPVNGAFLFYNAVLVNWYNETIKQYRSHPYVKGLLEPKAVLNE